jgi:hypothetical protein
MKNLPSVLLIDDETEFQEAFAESLKSETKKKTFPARISWLRKTRIKNN